MSGISSNNFSNSILQFEQWSNKRKLTIQQHKFSFRKRNNRLSTITFHCTIVWILIVGLFFTLMSNWYSFVTSVKRVYSWDILCVSTNSLHTVCCPWHISCRQQWQMSGFRFWWKLLSWDKMKTIWIGNDLHKESQKVNIHFSLTIANRKCK